MEGHNFNYLVLLLRTISTNQYTIHDTFSLVKGLFQQKFDNEIVKASFDVTSLFTKWIYLWMKPYKSLLDTFFVIRKFFMVFRKLNLSNFWI